MVDIILETYRKNIIERYVESMLYTEHKEAVGLVKIHLHSDEEFRQLYEQRKDAYLDSLVGHMGHVQVSRSMRVRIIEDSEHVLELLKKQGILHLIKRKGDLNSE